MSLLLIFFCSFFFFNDTAPTEIYTLSLHDALPICGEVVSEGVEGPGHGVGRVVGGDHGLRSEEHTSELQSLRHLVCRLLLEKKKKKINKNKEYSTHQRKHLYTIYN